MWTRARRALAELRGQDYTDRIIGDYFAGATSAGVQGAATAGLQIAAGTLGRALATATVGGDRGALDPHVLEGVGTDLVRSGRFLGLLRVDQAGRVRLLRAGAVASVVYGEADPDSWRYQLHLGGPSSAVTRPAGAAEVVNVRLNSDSYRPWEGVAPLARAAATGELYGRLAAQLGDEAAVLVTRIIPMPQGSNIDRDTLRGALTGKHLPGRVVFPETTSAGGGAGRSSAPLTDWKAMPTGWNAPEAAGKLYADLRHEVCEACGVPGQLVNPAGAGPAAREAWRRFTVGTVEPIARLLEAELTRVLEQPVRIRLWRMAGVDAAGRARAVHVMTEAGFDKETAAAMCGWD